MCGATHAPEDHGKPITARHCTLGCVKEGAKYILVIDGKIYKVSNQGAPGLAKYAGANVKVTGELSGDTITVSKIVKRS